MNDTPSLEEFIELLLEQCGCGKRDMEEFIANIPREETGLRVLLPLRLEMEGWTFPSKNAKRSFRTK